MKTDLEVFLESISTRTDLTGLRLFRGEKLDSPRPYATVFPLDLRASADDVLTEIARRGPEGARYELRASFETAPTERFSLAAAAS